MESLHPQRLAVIALISLLACCRGAYALDPSRDISQYAHTAWKVRGGFSKGAINAITQTPDGYLWLGTDFGLLRFDGVRNVPWLPPAGEHFPGNTITCLLASLDGTLWIGTRKGLASWKDGKLTNYPELAEQDISVLLEDHEGTVWASGWAITGKLCEFHGGIPKCSAGDSTLGHGALSLSEDGAGNLWAGTPTGLWRWQPGPPKLYALPGASPLFPALLEGGNGALVVATSGAIKQLVDGKLETFLPPTATQNLKQPEDMLRDRDGGLWVGTSDQGILHVHQAKTDSFAQSDGLSGNEVRKLFEDREGNIWVATPNGLDRFSESPVATISVKQGLSSSIVASVLADREGSIWMGTPDGLNRWKDGQITIYRQRSKPTQQSAPATGDAKPEHVSGPRAAREITDSGLPDDQIESLFQDDRGRIWVFTPHGVAVFENGRFTPAGALPGRMVASTSEDNAGNLWISSQDQGLFHLLNGKVIEQIPWSKLGHKDDASVLAADPVGGGLWLGFFLGGVAYFKDGQIRASYTATDGLGQGRVTGLQLDRDHTLWVATEGGLSRVKDGRLATLTSRNGLPCDTVHGVIEDEDSVWMYMACGLVRISRLERDGWSAALYKDDRGPGRRIQATVLDSSDGVQLQAAVSIYSPHIAKSVDGKLWFVPSDGISVVDPRHLHLNLMPPPVHIEQIIADRKTYDAASQVRLPPRVRDVWIDYTALSFVAPEKVRFRYELEGQDPDWKEVVNDRQVQYSNLAPGNYRFRVTACNNSGVWNEAGALLDFSIAPAYYQTTWFRATIAAALVLLCWGAYRIRIRNLEQRYQERALAAEKLQQSEEELRQLVEVIPQQVFVFDADWNPVFANRRELEYTGLTSQEMRSKAAVARIFHPEDLKKLEAARERARTDGAPIEMEARIRGKNGEYRWFLVRDNPLRGEQGRILRWYGTRTDVEDRKRAEDAWRKTLADLAHVNRAATMGELTASLAHEVNQPIAAAVTDANTCLRWLTRDQPDLEEARAAAARAAKDGMRAGEIISRIRQLFKKAAPQWELMDVNEVIREMPVLLQGEATQYAISVRMELAQHLPQIMGDRVQLQQVMMNLMINSFDAMKEVEGTRELTIQSQPGENDEVLVSVSDTGVGLPPQLADQVFTAFFTTKAHGTGMGLRISRSIVESHGGRLWAANNSPRGATFCFTLPAKAEARE